MKKQEQLEAHDSKQTANNSTTRRGKRLQIGQTNSAASPNLFDKKE
tara:strand:- start:518 stop:655 length:138 start_codon:yes stop_codon:yes gene_type:complete